jgi:flagellar biosynthesis regulator FlbT
VAIRSGIIETERKALILFHASKFDLVSEMYIKYKCNISLRPEVMADFTKHLKMLMSCLRIAVINHCLKRILSLLKIHHRLKKGPIWKRKRLKLFLRNNQQQIKCEEHLSSSGTKSRSPPVC